MSLQFSVAVRNGMLDAVETVTGASAVLKMFSGAQPVNCAAPDPSGLLCSMVLPADWMSAASAGAKAKLGTWAAAAGVAGIVASWRIYASDGTTCHQQGNTTDMTFDNTNVAVSQAVTVNTFTLTAPQA